MIFHDFFKLLLNVPRCYPRYVEMFLGPLEGVLSLRIHFEFGHDSQRKVVFSSPQDPNIEVKSRVEITLKIPLSIVSHDRIQNVFWGSKHLLGVPKTSLNTQNII